MNVLNLQRLLRDAFELVWNRLMRARVQSASHVKLGIDCTGTPGVQRAPVHTVSCSTHAAHYKPVGNSSVSLGDQQTPLPKQPANSVRVKVENKEDAADLQTNSQIIG
jgi:hypothetical protein